MAERYDPADLRVAVIFLRAIRGWDQAELAAAASVPPRLHFPLRERQVESLPEVLRADRLGRGRAGVDDGASLRGDPFRPGRGDRSGGNGS